MTNKDEAGFFTDYLSENEVDFSKKSAKKLEKHANWASALLKEDKVKSALQIKRDPERILEHIKQIKASLFEVRFAHLIYTLGFTAEHEYKTNVGNSSVDFRINNDPVWLIELTSLHEGEAVKQATTKSENGIHTYFSTTKPGENAPEIVDIIRAQRAICSKVADKSGNPLKFPEPQNNQYHMIVIDMRSFNAGGIDPYDYLNIAYGSKSLINIDHGFLCRNWIDQNGREDFVIGLFDDQHPDSNSKFIRERIHALGFIAEQSYDKGHLISNLKIFPNPNFFPKKEDYIAVLPKGFKK